MAFWGGSQLASGIPALDIVHPFNPHNIDCNAYTLTMGEEYYVTPQPGFSLRKSRKRKLKIPAGLSQPYQSLKGRGETFVIPPGQFAFLLTEERVKLPPNMMGFISLKSRIKFKGLINVSGFHVDPGFEGNLIYSVFNAGPLAIQIARGDPLFLLWLTELGGRVNSKYYKHAPSPQIEIPTELVSNVAHEIESLQGLSQRLNAAERRINLTWGVTAIVAGALTLFFALVAVLPQATLTNVIHFFRG